MKKYLFFLLFLAIGAMSCQKDIEQGSINAAKTNAVTPTNNKPSLFDATKPVDNDDVFVKINAFKAKLAKIESGTMPESDNSTTVAEAIWNIEALLNSRYGQAGKPFKKINSAVSTIRVPLNDDGTINNASLVIASETARQKLSEQYNAVTIADKHVIAIDIRKKEPQIESGGSVLIEVSGLIGGILHSDLTPFEIGDDWFWGFQLGTCSMPVATNQGTDAADKLNEKLNPRAVSSNVFFTDVSEFFFGEPPLLNPNDGTPNDNNRDFLTFFQDMNIGFSECIVSQDMTFYLGGAVTVINTFKPAGKSFISINLIGTSVPPNNTILHIGTIQYGIKHVSHDNEVPCC